jgi:hypothetical protein
MTTKELLLDELEKTPEPLLGEILDFVQFLKVKATRPGFETAQASEPVLGRDWLRPEEDEAWQIL